MVWRGSLKTDLDVFLAPDADNILRLKRALRAAFDDPEIEEISAADLLGDYPVVQYVPPDGSFHLVLVTRLGDAFVFDDIESTRLVFDDITVSVATPKALYRMKRDTVWLKDKADAEMLRQRFNLES